MLCTRCGKRPAVVFVSNNNSKDAPTAGYCLTCAKELGIKPVEDLISKMGISDEDLENVQDQMNTLMNSMGDGDMSQLMEQLGADNLAEQMGDFSKDGDGSEDDDFSHGAPAFPAFFNSMFGGQNNNATNQDNNKKGKKEKKEKNRKHINLYCEDLTRKAREGKIDRIVGRDSEIERVIQILSRRTKNNPCLIGEPGVGKTAIAEGLALRIAAGNVTQRLKNKEIQLLDLTSLVAGTQFRGQFESRIKGLVSEIKENGNIILFIDEVHSLVGTGDNEGTMNAANILKPALSRSGDGRSVALISYNSNGEAQYTINTEHKADSLSVYKGTVAILDGNVVYGYNQNGDLLYSTNSGTGSKKIVLASDYTAYILSVNQIRFIDLDSVSSDDTAQTSKQE